MPFFQLQGKEGYIARVTKDGELKIYLEVDSINASNIVVRDPEDEDKQLVVNPDGSINVKNMDLALSALRDALQGDDDKTLTDLATLLGGTLDVQLRGSTTLSHTAVNVTTSSGQVVAANSSRKYLLLVNDSDAVIYIKVGAAAALNQGICLNPSGSYEMGAGFGNLDTRAVYAIHGSTGNKVLLVTEGV